MVQIKTSLAFNRRGNNNNNVFTSYINKPSMTKSLKISSNTKKV